MTSRTRAAIVVALLVAFAAVLAVCARHAPPPPGEIPSHFEHRSGSLVYTYQVATNDESLFDTDADPRMLKNLRDERPADLERLRGEFMRNNDLRSLEELRRPESDLIARLKANGYF